MTRSTILFRFRSACGVGRSCFPGLCRGCRLGIRLGTVLGFDNEEAARTHCQGDGVVWADRKTGFYYPKFAPEYGASPTGSFACYKDAKKADYWGRGGGGDAMAGSRSGRVFPFYPEPECDYRVDKKTGKGFCAQPGS